MKRHLLSFLGIVLVLTVGSTAYAKFARTEDAIAYRKAVMEVMSHHFGQIGAVVKGQIPFQAKTVADNAGLVKTLSVLPWEAFKVPGSDKGATHLKPAALAKPDQFAAAAKSLEEEVARLAALTEESALDQVKAQFGKVAQSCKNCHDQFTAH